MPGPRSQAQRRRTYDRLSGWYDWLAGPGERRLRDLGLARLGARPGERVLEIGPGTGAALLRLAQAVGPSGRAAAVELSPGMLRRCQRRLATSGEAVRLIRAEAARLPLATACFDAVFMSFTLELFDDSEIPEVLRQCIRVLAEAGRLGIVALSTCRGETPTVRLYQRAHRLFPSVIDCRPIDVSDWVRSSRLALRHHEVASMWGLPVEIVIAHRPAGAPVCGG